MSDTQKGRQNGRQNENGRRDEDLRTEDEEEMKTVNIASPFTFTHQDGTIERFRPGAYELPTEIANHWFVQAHCEESQEPRRLSRQSTRMKRGTPQHEAAMQTANHMDTIEDQAERDEVARVTEEVRRKFREQRMRRPGERARLNEDVVRDESGEA